MAASVFDMACAVSNLVLLEKKRLNELDELTVRQGYKVDQGFAGLRIMIARGEGALHLLHELAPYEAELTVWLLARRAAKAALVDVGSSSAPASV